MEFGRLLLLGTPRLPPGLRNRSPIPATASPVFRLACLVARFPWKRASPFARDARKDEVHGA